MEKKKLAGYRAKRDLERSGEPSGATRRGGGDGPLFVIQKHAASEPPLRLPARGRRRAALLGGAEGAVDRPAREAPGRRGRGPPARLRRLRGRDRRRAYGAGAVIVWDSRHLSTTSTRSGRWPRRSSAGHLSGLARTARSCTGGYTLQRTGGGRQAAVAADQAPRRGRRRPAQPGEHRARVGPQRPHGRAGRRRGRGDELHPRPALARARSAGWPGARRRRSPPAP